MPVPPEGDGRDIIVLPLRYPEARDPPEPGGPLSLEEVLDFVAHFLHQNYPSRVPVALRLFREGGDLFLSVPFPEEHHVSAGLSVLERNLLRAAASLSGEPTDEAVLEAAGYRSTVVRKVLAGLRARGLLGGLSEAGRAALEAEDALRERLAGREPGGRPAAPQAAAPAPPPEAPPQAAAAPPPPRPSRRHRRGAPPAARAGYGADLDELAKRAATGQPIFPGRDGRHDA
jgi:hypothetical protein